MTDGAASVLAKLKNRAKASGISFLRLWEVIDSESVCARRWKASETHWE